MAATDCGQKSQAIQLFWEQKDDTIVVTPQDNDRFAVKVGKAIQVLQQQDHQLRFQDQLQLLHKVLIAWLRTRGDVHDAYLTLRDGCLAFVVIRKSPEYDEAFEDELSSLDVRLAQDVDLDLIRINTISLPCVSQSAFQSFLDSSFALRYQHAPRA